MENILSVSEREAKCYEYFHTNSIKSRQELRDCWKQKQIPGVRANFIEDIFSDFMLQKKLDEKRRDDIKANTNHSQIFVLSDIHIPFQDDDTLANVFDCIIDSQPQYIVLLGDILDCYSISRFCKRPDRIRNLQHEIDVFYKLMRGLKKQIPNTEIHYVLGNHENRLEKLVLENPGLFGLKALEPQKLFRLDELGIFYHKTKVKLNNFIYYHGDAVRKDASYSAKAEYMDHKMQDGVSGHTHRLGSYYTTYEQEPSGWFENGCLCKIEPDYLNDPDKANWQQGFTIVDSFDGINQATQILINKHKFAYNGKIYK